jgi:hypothetical protein
MELVTYLLLTVISHLPALKVINGWIDMVVYVYVYVYVCVCGGDRSYGW